jgi:hypothetical protein
MIYKFRIISSENEDFIREVAIDSQAHFLSLHNFIVEELNYEKGQMTSFFLTDQNWHKETEVTLIDMEEGQNPDRRVMDKAKLGELITEKKQRMLYVFDQFAERSLFLELFAIMDDELEQPKCIRRNGQPPTQFDHGAMASGDLEDLDLNELLGGEDLDTQNIDENEIDLNDWEEDWY